MTVADNTASLSRFLLTFVLHRSLVEGLIKGSVRVGRRASVAFLIMLPRIHWFRDQIDLQPRKNKEPGSCFHGQPDGKNWSIVSAPPVTQRGTASATTTVSVCIE